MSGQLVDLQPDPYNVTLQDFYPVNQWEVNRTSQVAFNNGQPKWITDLTTKKNYLNEPVSLVRFKCIALVLATPFLYAIAVIENIASNLFILFQVSHLEVAKYLSLIVATPLIVVGLELVAIYGLLRPYDGRKLFGTIERAVYGVAIAAPCFQPNADLHLLGGNIDEQNAI